MCFNLSVPRRRRYDYYCAMDMPFDLFCPTQMEDADEDYGLYKLQYFW
jgi:hypothetical protein